MSTKEKQFEEARRQLNVLKKENDSIRIEEIMLKFFTKRNIEENMLNKIEMINSL